MAKITIDKLIKRLLEDKRFARQFKTLSDRCARDRDNLLEKGVKDRPAAQRYLKSWGEFHRKFAFDPESLAALMLPVRKTEASYTCPTMTGDFVTLTGTESARLLASVKPRQRKPAEKYPRASGTTKKATKKK